MHTPEDSTNIPKSVKKSDTVKNTDTKNHASKQPKKKKKTGRPRGIRTHIIPDWKRQYMYQVWAEKKDMAYVARTCDVAVGTVIRYKELDGWEKRLTLEVEKQAQDIMLTPEAEKLGLDAARKLAISQLQIARGRALEAIMTLEIKKPSDAWRMFTEALKQELELRGHQKPPEVSIVLLAAQRYQAQRDGKKPTDITDDAEVTDVDADD